MISPRGIAAISISAVALGRLWTRPLLGLWWAALGILLFEFWSSFALKNALEMYGPDSDTTRSIGALRALTDFFLIGISIYALAL